MTRKNKYVIDHLRAAKVHIDLAIQAYERQLSADEHLLAASNELSWSFFWHGYKAAKDDIVDVEYWPS